MRWAWVIGPPAHSREVDTLSARSPASAMIESGQSPPPQSECCNATNSEAGRFAKAESRAIGRSAKQACGSLPGSGIDDFLALVVILVSEVTSPRHVHGWPLLVGDSDRGALARGQLDARTFYCSHTASGAQARLALGPAYAAAYLADCRDLRPSLAASHRASPVAARCRPRHR